MAINKEKILEFITEEKDKFNSYSQLCAQYKVDPDELVLVRHQSKIEAFEQVLKWMQK